MSTMTVMATLDYRQVRVHQCFVGSLATADGDSVPWHMARVIECWYRQCGRGQERLRDRLISKDDTEFMAAW